jgi:response regulator NasT
LPLRGDGKNRRSAALQSVLSTRPGSKGDAVPSDSEPQQRLRVLVANEDDAQITTLVSIVAGLGHEVIAQTIDVALVGELAAREQPDVALVSLGPNTDHAVEMIERIVQEATCPVIALTHAPDAAFVSRASALGVFAAITDREPDEWQSAIEVALSRFGEYQRLRSAFDRRALIERANGILMERHSVAADVAFEMLRDTSRRRNRKLAELAAAVVDGHSLLPPGPAPDIA